MKSEWDDGWVDGYDDEWMGDEMDRKDEADVDW